MATESVCDRLKSIEHSLQDELKMYEKRTTETDSTVYASGFNGAIHNIEVCIDIFSVLREKNHGLLSSIF